jgi:transcriptional regulator with GAF, ATPase, and Fis domain
MRHGSETKDAPPEGWVAWARRRSAREPTPRLRLLVHGDLGRVGWLSVPGTLASDGSWLVVGRNEPPFGGAGPARPRYLDDPHVSRAQLRLRWLRDIARFEVEPVQGAKRPVLVVHLGPGVEAAQPIAGPTILEPGACVAVGDRVLLGLEVGGFRPPDEDRLGLVGESEVMWALRDEIRSVAQFGRAVLVNGPTGAGKELVARAVHQHSPRAAGPFVAVNCAALPETLVESVLFGHRKGAFTGAVADEKGLFGAADGGTLFFDELGELPIGSQPKLLRVLQDGVVVPVGAHEGRRVDVRVVAATHRDLEAHVRAGKLREDLYHRLSAHVLRVPPLRERRFDVPELFVHALGRLRAEHPALAWMWEGAKEWRLPLPIGFLVDLMRRQWGGNVRELQNLAERTARLNLHPGAFQAPEGVLSEDASDGGHPQALGGHPQAPGVESSQGGDSSGSTPHTPRPSDATLPSPADEAQIRAASDTLGVARKTLLKLLSPSALASQAAEADRLGVDGAERTRRLRAAAAEALLAMLEAKDFNQSVVAAGLGTSRTTLIKLMDDLGLPRAADLGAEEIERALARARRDLDAAARTLRVSPGALKKRATQLGLKVQG